MSKTARNILFASLGLLALGLAVFASLRLYPLIYDFDTVAVPVVIQDRPDSLGKTFDEILLRHIKSFSYIKSFNRMFAKGAQRQPIQKAFFIDRCEVSQGEFHSFVNWAQLHAAKIKSIQLPGQPRAWKYESNTRTHAISGKLTAAVSGVSYYDAVAYCRSAGGRFTFCE